MRKAGESSQAEAALCRRTISYAQAESLEAAGAEVEHAHLAAIVHSSAESIISMATAGTILSWNEASSRLYG